MKRMIATLTALILLAGLVPALAEELPEDCIDLAEGHIASVDLDGDGVPEDVSWAMTPGEYDDMLALTVDPGDYARTYWTDIIYNGQVYIKDLDDDGIPEILMTGDVASDDYYTWCLRYMDGRLTEVLFPDSNRGENTNGYFPQGYGLITRLTDYYIELSGSQDVLGTWMASRRISLERSGHFEFCDNYVWERAWDPYSDEDNLWEYAALTVRSPVAYTGDHGCADGILEPGDQLLVYATDKQSEALFYTPDDITGILSISPDYERGWGWLVNGVPEEDCFEYIPYAD